MGCLRTASSPLTGFPIRSWIICDRIAQDRIGSQNFHEIVSDRFWIADRSDSADRSTESAIRGNPIVDRSDSADRSVESAIDDDPTVHGSLLGNAPNSQNLLLVELHYENLNTATTTRVGSRSTTLPGAYGPYYVYYAWATPLLLTGLCCHLPF